MRKVFLEGKTDFVFVRALGIPRKNARVLDSKGEVCNYLAKHSEAIGLVDEDPGDTPSKYLQKLKMTDLEHALLLYQDTKNNNKVVALRPRLEEWLLRICKQSGVKMSEFNLPDKPKELHYFLPQHPEHLEKLIRHLLELKSPALLLLQSHLLEK